MLQTDNREFEKPLKWEAEILELLDYSLPLERWEWWKSSHVAQILPGTADVRQVGRALVKVREVLGSGLTVARLDRSLDGITLSLLPLQHHRYGFPYFEVE